MWFLLALAFRARPWLSLASWLRPVLSHKPCPSAAVPRWLSSGPVVQIYSWSLFRRYQSKDGQVVRCKEEKAVGHLSAFATRQLSQDKSCSMIVWPLHHLLNYSLCVPREGKGAVSAAMEAWAMQQVPDLLAFQQPLQQQCGTWAPGQGSPRQRFKTWYITPKPQHLLKIWHPFWSGVQLGTWDILLLLPLPVLLQPWEYWAYENAGCPLNLQVYWQQQSLNITVLC